MGRGGKAGPRPRHGPWPHATSSQPCLDVFSLLHGANVKSLHTSPGLRPALRAFCGVTICGVAYPGTSALGQSNLSRLGRAGLVLVPRPGLVSSARDPLPAARIMTCKFYVGSAAGRKWIAILSFWNLGSSYSHLDQIHFHLSYKSPLLPFVDNNYITRSSH